MKYLLILSLFAVGCADKSGQADRHVVCYVQPIVLNSGDAGDGYIYKDSETGLIVDKSVCDETYQR
jgi:hypothetical protein